MLFQQKKTTTYATLVDFVIYIYREKQNKLDLNQCYGQIDWFTLDFYFISQMMICNCIFEYRFNIGFVWWDICHLGKHWILHLYHKFVLIMFKMFILIKIDRWHFIYKKMCLFVIIYVCLFLFLLLLLFSLVTIVSFSLLLINCSSSSYFVICLALAVALFNLI